MENRTCQNCKNEFVVDAQDFAFYERTQVPAPTWCPDCRFWRRTVWQNMRGLHHGLCELCGNKTLSIFAPGVEHRVYCHNCWWSDKWDQNAFGKEYDSTRSFLVQFFELFKQAPTPALSNSNPINSEYIQHTSNSKNCYLVFFSGGAAGNEDCSYSYRLDGCKNCVDCSYTTQSENSYELIDATHCNNVFYSRYTENSFDSAFLYDCRNCSNCFGSIGLRNKQNYFFNAALSKDAYQEKLRAHDTGSYQAMLSCRKQADELVAKHPHVYANIVKSMSCTGDDIVGSKNCKDCYFIKNSEESKYIVISQAGVHDSYDVHSGFGEQLYECFMVIGSSSKIFYSGIVIGSKNLQYCYFMINCSDCFGCVGLRNKQYCILNKQYTKEEYQRLVPKIIAQMITEKHYGEFFPIEESPFPYNDTVAQEYVQLTQEGAESRGLGWYEPAEKNYKITLDSANIPDIIRTVGDDILNQVIACAHKGECFHHCSTAFRITPAELEFYHKANLPLPRLCHNCRYYDRAARRNPFKLWHRHCMKEGCKNEFETTYAPEKKAIVYCESCYQQEVV